MRRQPVDEERERLDDEYEADPDSEAELEADREGGLETELERAATRAEYALEEGEPALQPDPTHTRRIFLAAASGAFLLGAAAGFLGGHFSASAAARGARSEERVDDYLAFARQVATWETDELEPHAMVVLSAVRNFGGDPILWDAVGRLLRRAVDRGLRADSRLGEELLVTVAVRRPPEALNALVEQLRGQMQVRVVPRERR